MGEAEDPSEVQLTAEQLHLVELYVDNPNITQIAAELGVHRSTIHRRLHEPGVEEAILELQIKRDEDRDTQVEEAQDMALKLISLQLKQQLKDAEDNPKKVGVADTQKLMQIAEKLGVMKKERGKASREVRERARREREGEIDWGTDPTEDE